MKYVIVFGIISFSLTVVAFYFKKKSDGLYREMQDLLKIYNSDEGKIIQESFLKFVSDSREWAFQYIEDVQLHLKTFKNSVEKEINYFNQYGEVGSAYPHYDSMKKISAAYKELIKVLPEDNDDKA